MSSSSPSILMLLLSLLETSTTATYVLTWVVLQLGIFTASQTINACREWGEQPTGLSAVMDISYRVHRRACSIIKDSCYPHKEQGLMAEGKLLSTNE